MQTHHLRNHALVIAEAAQLNAEIAAMQAANQERLSLGHSIAYDEEAFRKAAERYSTASYNGVQSLHWGL